MAEKEKDEQLRLFKELHKNNWQHLTSVLRRQLDHWSNGHVKSPEGKMKLSYLPVIFNISVDGSTASEIGQRAMVIKQTMSRTISELEEKGMIVTTINKKDKRSELIHLTDLGKDLVLDAHKELAILTQTYKDLVGENDFGIAESVLLKIIQYHHSLNEDTEE